MINKSVTTKKAYMVFAGLVSVVFGAALSLTPVLHGGSEKSWNPLLMIVGTLGFFLSFYALVYLVEGKALPANKQKSKLSDKQMFFLLFSVMTLVGLFYLLIYWPGTGMYDTTYIIKADHWGVARQHPWFYCLCVALIVDFVQALGGDYNVAIPFLSFLQIAFTALLYSGALIWLRKKGINKILWWALAAIYTFYPIFNMYMVTLFKDIPYSLLLFIWIPLLYDLWKSEGALLKNKKFLLLLCGFLILSLLRNNGVYVSAFILLGMLLCYKKFWKQIALLFAVLVMVIVGSSAFEKSQNITHLFKETVGIPLQQIAATVCEGEVTQEQEEFISQILPIDYIKENYNPYTADTLKWGSTYLNNEFLNANKAEFLKLWAEMLIPNFGIYVEAYLKNTYSFWSLTGSEQNQVYTTFYVEALDYWYKEQSIKIKDIFPENIQATLEKITTALSKSPESGKLLWLVILILLVLGFVHNLKLVSIGLPLIGGWITIMISTPVAFQWRYTLYMAMALPLLIGIMFIKEKAKVKKEPKDIPLSENQ